MSHFLNEKTRSVYLRHTKARYRFTLSVNLRAIFYSIHSTEAVTFFIRSNVAVLHVYYKEKTGFLYKTEIRFRLEDIIGILIFRQPFLLQNLQNYLYFPFPAAIGGVLSLGLGISFIGVIEFIYYFFVRPCLSVLSKQRTANSSLLEEPFPLSYRSERADNNKFHFSSSTSIISSFSSLSDSQLEEATITQEIIDLTVIQNL